MKTRLSATALAAALSLAVLPTTFAQVAPAAAPIRALDSFPAKDKATLIVTSPAFKAGEDIPFENSQTRGNTFPGLSWSKGPRGTQSYVALMQDMGSVIRGNYVLHWTLYDIPAGLTKLDAGMKEPPAGSIYGPNQRATRAYMGPRPGPGDKHPYHIEVFALDRVIPQDPAMTWETLAAAISGHVLASGELVGMGVPDPNAPPPQPAATPTAPAAPATENGPPMKTTFVRLTNNSNAIVVETATPDPTRNRIAILVTHPEHANNFNYFTGLALAKYGYRAMLLNYYGPEQTYDEFIAPIAAAIKTLRALPGVQKVVLAGHSTGGPELTSYQDIAENGPQKACQGPERIYKCRVKNLDDLPKADGVLLLDSSAGSPERTIALNPGLDPKHPAQRNANLDMFDPKNGFDPTTKTATYSEDFKRKFSAAQGARANRLIDEALARLAKIEQGQGDYKDDEPFVVAGAALAVNGDRLELADIHVVAKTHAPHLLLKPDGSKAMQVFTRVSPSRAEPELEDTLFHTTINASVRSYLSFEALRVTGDYRLGEDSVTGIQWRSTPNSTPGNVEGIRVPTLVVASTCAPHLVFEEIAYEHSAATDKQIVGVEGADHGFRPCKPEYGDTFKRTFDFVDSWLTAPGRF